ncbi:MAG: hypothetical protein KGL39_46985 [Patescibacteria group bacterium]|nr:hypothetical protein [Patescibacteria group bacterium]
MTPYAEKLLAKHDANHSTKWFEGIVDGKVVRLRLVDRNFYGRCLLEFPDGIVRQLDARELNRRFVPCNEP